MGCVRVNPPIHNFDVRIVQSRRFFEKIIFLTGLKVRVSLRSSLA